MAVAINWICSPEVFASSRWCRGVTRMRSSLFADISISLLSLVVTACGLALFGVSLFVSWKLCWIPWRERGLPFGNKDSKQEPLHYAEAEADGREYSEDYLGQPAAFPEASMKISHTSPDLPLDTQEGSKENCVPNVRMQRQVTEPTSSARSVTSIPLCCSWLHTAQQAQLTDLCNIYHLLATLFWKKNKVYKSTLFNIQTHSLVQYNSYPLRMTS